MLRVTTMNWILFLLWLSIFLDHTNAQREIVECTVRDGDNEIHLELRRTEQILANQHLPIWTVKPRKRRYCQREDLLSHQLRPNFVNENIGDFVLYHDKEKSAAVTLFRRTDTLVGIIDTRYVIFGLPLNECNSIVDVGGAYVKHMNCESMNPEEHLKTLDLSMPRNEGSATRPDGTPPPVVDDSVTTLYPEIMVFVSHDITEIIKIRYENDYLAIIVAQYLMFFNAVDMLISKLSTDYIKLHLNLAGIVIEDQENSFNFLKPHYGDGRASYIDVRQTPSQFTQYGAQNYHVFPQDSFDFFFISTGKQLWNTRSNYVDDGWSWRSGMYDERRARRYYRYWPGAVAHYTCGFEYISASHEIAHLMAINHDPLDKGYRRDNVQCYAVMQEVNAACPDCLKWSDESIEYLKIFARYNRDHCYLLNRPRSLHPYGSRIRTLSLSEQCRCFGYQLEANGNLDEVSRRGCSQRLDCGRNSEGLVLPFPIDGTPCSNDRVCWDEACRQIQNIP